jgi:hypothetical protein
MLHHNVCLQEVMPATVPKYAIKLLIIFSRSKCHKYQKKTCYLNHLAIACVSWIKCEVTREKRLPFLISVCHPRKIQLKVIILLATQYTNQPTQRMVFSTLEANWDAKSLSNHELSFNRLHEETVYQRTIIAWTDIFRINNIRPSATCYFIS